jgi:hypothetical protein
MLEIHSSARKHGIADDDIEHAVTHAMAIDDIDDTRLYLGPARNAALLEVVTSPPSKVRSSPSTRCACVRSTDHLLPEH